MIRDDKRAPALRSLHGIFVGVRYLAATSAPLNTIAKACDVAEHLPNLFEGTEDATEYFRAQLVDLAGLDNVFGFALECFDGHLEKDRP